MPESLSVAPNEYGASLTSHRRTGRVMWRLAAPLIIFASTALFGCESARFYDSEADKLATAAQEAYEKIDFTSAFETERVFLKDLSSKTDPTVTDRVLVSRDLFLLLWIREPGTRAGRPATSWEAMREYVASRSKDLLGDADRIKQVTFSFAAKVAVDQEIFAQESIIDQNRKFFEQRGGKADNLCDDPKKPVGAWTNEEELKARSATDHADATSAYLTIKVTCPLLRIAIRKVENPLSDVPEGGLWKDVNNQLNRADELIRAQKALSKEINTTLATLTKNYQCALEASKIPNTLEANVTAAKGLIGDFLMVLESAETEARNDVEKATNELDDAPDAKGDKKVAKKKEDKCPSREDVLVPQFEELLKKAGLKKSTLDGIVNALPKVPVGKVIADTLKKASADFTASKANKALTAVVDPTSKVEDPRVRTALAVFQAFAKVSAIPDEETASQHVDVLLTSLTFQQFKVETAKIQLDSLTPRRKLLAARRDAVITEVRLLAQAHRALQKIEAASDSLPRTFAGLRSDPKVGDDARISAAQALNSLAASWNDGRLPIHLSEFREIQIDRERNAALDEVALSSRIKLSEPVIKQLTIAAKSGIKPEMIAQALSALGITATAIGVNR